MAEAFQESYKTTCPTCGAKPGQPCLENGQVAKAPHKERFEAAIRLIAPPGYLEEALRLRE